jgi:hypothetical protein
MASAAQVDACRVLTFSVPANTLDVMRHLNFQQDHLSACRKVG